MLLFTGLDSDQLDPERRMTKTSQKRTSAPMYKNPHETSALLRHIVFSKDLVI